MSLSKWETVNGVPLAEVMGSLGPGVCLKECLTCHLPSKVCTPCQHRVGGVLEILQIIIAALRDLTVRVRTASVSRGRGT